MKKSLAVLGMSGIFALCCLGQNADPPGNTSTNGGGLDQGAYYATLNRRVLECRTQFDLLSALAQEHQKRAAEAPGDQAQRAQWESELARDLEDRATTVLARLNSASKERLAFEQRHPEVATAPPLFSLVLANAGNADEAAFLGKLEERLAAVQQEINETIEAGKIYQAQLLTNGGTSEFSRLSFLLQDNGYAVKRLQKEIADLELMRLEFRALRKEH